MASKILKSILAVAFTVLIATAVFVVDETYQNFTASQSEVLKAETQVIAHGITRFGLSFLDGLDKSDYRITVIDHDGKVIYDNSGNDITAMDNHLNREEIIEALNTGYGNCIRRSTTSMEKAIYTAILLADGNIVRLSSTYPSFINTLSSVVQPLLQVMVFISGLSLLIAYHLTNRIVKPLNELNIDDPQPGEYYREIRPIMHKISSQQKMISHDKEMLKRSRQEFETITANMNEGLMLINTENVIVDINRAAESLLGVDESIIGKKLEQLAVHDLFDGLAQETVHSQRASRKTRINGRQYILEASPIISEGELIGTALLMFDDSYKEANELFRREFASNVSHELKTPLQAISGYAELLKNDLVREEDRNDCVDKIFIESNRMMRLVEDVIKLSHLDDESAVIHKERLDLYQLCRQAVEIIRKQIDESITITLEGEPAYVYGNREMLESIINNLTDNAVKYNHKNGTVAISVTNETRDVILKVADSGIGIAEKDQKRIFERFYRVDKSRSKAVGGTGLGLSIVKHACILNNGTITLKSQPGKGSEFTVTFPRA
ncbi:MAG: PAS domain-containing protein [Erysipelotrichaceae bacterium]|nr:PAS domain-containing protein [Erysipelotrichaceae bacterium]